MSTAHYTSPEGIEKDFDPDYNVVFEDIEDIVRFERQALDGKRSTGDYLADATAVDREARANSWDGRHTPGVDVEHDRRDLISITRVLEGEDPVSAKRALEEELEEIDREFIYAETEDESAYRQKHRVATRQEGDRVILRACYFCD